MTCKRLDELVASQDLWQVRSRATFTFSLGHAKSSLGDAKSSLGDAKSSLGDALCLATICERPVALTTRCSVGGGLSL